MTLRLNRKLIFLAVLAVSVVAWAANVFNAPVFFRGGIRVGAADLVTLVDTCLLSNADLPTAGVGITTFVTGTCTGAALGDTCQIGPLQDDAAWDEGTLTCFVESADTVKLVYNADVTGGDPAATNDYNVVLTRF